MNWVISQSPLSKKQTSMIRRKFTQEEDTKLCQLVNQYGAKKWDQIAKMMPGRTGRQCRDRYRNYLIPGFFNGQWSQEEDELLHEKFNQMGRQWARMMQFFPGRSANSLKNRWNYFVCRLNQEQNQNQESKNTNDESNEKSDKNQKEEIEMANDEIPENENPGKDNLQEQNDQTLNQPNTELNETSQPETEERIIYGVNASTQTNESDFLNMT